MTLRLKRVNPDVVKAVKVEVVITRQHRGWPGLMCIPGQLGLGRCDWGLVIFWYTAEQFNWVRDRLAQHGYRPKWETTCYYAHPHIMENRYKWNASRTESFIADAPRGYV